MFEPGTQVGRYEIQRRLGRGGMGTVYVAHDPVLGRMVAIKVFAGDLDMPDARERFSREARAAAALSHPNIVTVFDFGEFASQPYIVMEYVAGETMANLIRRKVAVSMADKLRWMEELCAAAGYAHQMSVVHRDIKPANLIIDRSGRLKILDFGIARMLGIASNTAVMIGTPGYMAPEQITGDPVDHRSDQFSIGIVFYELLAYAEPFPGDTLPMIAHRIVSQEPTPLEQLVPDISPDLVAIVGQALKKSSAQRFKDADTMRVAIGRVRRKYESDDDWNTPTMPVGQEFTPMAGGNKGTGSARRRSNEAVGVAQLTPPPDPRRTDREALARRRTAQLEAALLLARTLLEQRQLDDALDACQQALTLDETHVGALALEEEIQTALRLRDGLDVGADDAALTTANEPTVLDPGLEEIFAETGLPRASSAPRQATSSPVVSRAGLGVGDQTVLRPAVLPPPVDATIIAPARRTPSPPPVQPARPATVAPPTAQARQAPAKPSSTPVKKKEHSDFLTPVMQAIRSALQAVGPAVGSAAQVARGVTSRGKASTIWVGAGIGALALVGVAAFLLTRGPAPTGVAIVDAVPWANVMSIKGEDGEEYPVPSPASTPLSLALPAGTYQITLTGPGSEPKTETVNVRVDVGGTNAAAIARFPSMTVEEYFEQYLGPAEAPAPAAQEGTSTDTAPPPAAAPGPSEGGQ